MHIRGGQKVVGFSSVKGKDKRQYSIRQNYFKQSPVFRRADLLGKRCIVPGVSHRSFCGRLKKKRIAYYPDKVLQCVRNKIIDNF